MLPIETISARDLDGYINRPDAVIIDLRTPEEYKKSHIRTAVNIPYENLNTCRQFSRKNSSFSTVREEAAAYLLQGN